MSFVSNGSLNEKTTPYIGICSRSGWRPYVASSSAARSSASGSWRNISHTGGAPGGSGPCGRMPVEVAPAGDGTLAPDVEGGERIHLPGIRHADDHPELLLHGGIGGRRLHAAVFERRPRVLVEIGQDRGGLDGFRRESAAAPARARRPVASGTGAPSSVTSSARDPVIGAHAVDIVLHDRDAGRLPGLDRRVQLVDRRLFQTKRLVVRDGLVAKATMRRLRHRQRQAMAGWSATVPASSVLMALASSALGSGGHQAMRHATWPSGRTRTAPRRPMPQAPMSD